MTSPETEVCEPHHHQEIKTEYEVIDKQSQELHQREATQETIADHINDLSSPTYESTYNVEENQQNQSARQLDEQQNQQQIQQPKEDQQQQQQQPRLILSRPVGDSRKRRHSSHYSLKPEYKKKQPRGFNNAPNWSPSVLETSWPFQPDFPISNLPEIGSSEWHRQAMEEFNSIQQNLNTFLFPDEIQQNNIQTFPNEQSQLGSNPPTTPMPPSVPSTSESSKGSNPMQGNAGSRWRRLKKFLGLGLKR